MMLHLESIRLFIELKSRTDIDSFFVSNIESINVKMSSKLQRVSIVFNEYTLHDIQHSYRIMETMYDLVDNIYEIKSLDICMMIISALLHDVGMVAENDEIVKIKSNSDQNSEFKFSNYLKNYKTEQIALQEYIRNIHAKRSAIYIKSNLIDELSFPNNPSLNIVDEIASICQSHTESYNWIEENLKSEIVVGKFNGNPKFVACLLRIADILDIDPQRTPYNLFRDIDLNEISKSEWIQHFQIKNYDKISLDTDGNKIITFYGECDNPKIHRKVLKYIKWVNEELAGAYITTKSFKEGYKLNLKQEVLDKITPKGYHFSDIQIKVNYNAIVNLLMGEKIYGSRKYGLREVIQNSIDACKMRKEIESIRNIYGSDYKPSIKIIVNEVNNELIVKDNGIGMTLDTIMNHFLSVGSSYYTTNNFKLSGFNFAPIGNFGIGFLACFMLSKNIKLATRHIDSQDKYELELEAGSEYTTINTKKDVNFQGTELYFDLTTVCEAFEVEVEDISISLQSFVVENILPNGIDYSLVTIGEVSKTSTFKELLEAEHKHKSSFHLLKLKNVSNDFEGEILVEYFNPFIKSVNQYHEIENSYDNFSYKNSFSYNDQLIPLEINDNIFPFIYGEGLAVLKLLIIDDVYADDFIEISNKEDYENYNDSIEELSGVIEVVYIFLNPEKFNNQFENIHEEYGFGEIFETENFFPGLICDTAFQQGHSSKLPVLSALLDFPVFKDPNSPVVLPLRGGRNGDYDDLTTHSIYLRDIKINSTSLEYFSLLQTSLVRINAYNINIISNYYKPNLPREDLDQISKKKFFKEISIILLQDYLSHFTINPEETICLTGFLQDLLQTQ